jgi:uncharacterized protein YjbI with pentapeptide repeats
MKTIKPQRLSALTRVFEYDRACVLAITPIVYFAFEPQGALLPEVALWKFVPGELADGVLDLAMPKPRGEVLVTGRAYARNGVPQPAVAVRVKLGTVDKTLRAVGNRYWHPDSGAMSNIEPFTEMPITWANAYGGPGYAPNPVGKGAAPVAHPSGGEVQYIANIEDPRRPLQSPDDRPALPAGLAGYDMTWPQRMAKAGTYDAAWLDTLFPGLAADVDWTMFNAAPDDQQIAGSFQGDERFVLENLHPARALIESRLPGVRTRAFVTQRQRDGSEVFREVLTRLETVHLFPHAERGVLLFRGVIPVSEDDAADIVHLVLACERLGEPRPVEHYQQELTLRLDRERGAARALRDDALMPTLPPATSAMQAEARDDAAELSRMENRLKKNARARLRKQLDEARQRAVALGIDPAEAVPPELAALADEPDEAPPADFEQLIEVINAAEAEGAAEAEKMEREKAEEHERYKVAMASIGIDGDQAVADAQREAAGPPRFSAVGHIARIRSLAREANHGAPVPDLEAQLDAPELLERLLTQERQLQQMYQRIAHMQPAVRNLAPAAAAALRASVEAAAAAREGFALRDFTGADLTGVDLTGADLRGAWFESATLTNARLAGADLTDAVLARADLTGADLTGAVLTNANLGSAVLAGAHCPGAQFEGTTLMKADLRGANLRGARLERVDLTEALLGPTNLEGVVAPELIVIKTSLAGARFVSAKLTKITFVDVTLTDADFTGADMTGGAFVGVSARASVFRDARLENFRAVSACDFAGSDFTGATLDASTLRGSDLSDCEFANASLEKADLSEAQLRGARFAGANAREASFVRAELGGADLREGRFLFGNFQKARIDGVDLARANLFRADFGRVRGGARSTDGAYVEELKILPKAPHGT